MNRDTREYINKVADCMRDVFRITTPIGDMAEIVERIGGTVEELTDPATACDGSIKKTGSGFVITVPAYRDKQRKDFAIAHELGHLVLHCGYMTNEEVWNSLSGEIHREFGTMEQERQANGFAEALLMPAEEYRKAVSEAAANNRVDMTKIAERFDVSFSVVADRGRFLGIIA